MQQSAESWAMAKKSAGKGGAARGVGRPEKPASEQQINVPVRFPQAMIEAIDTVRAGRIDAPDRSKMIRELVALGLTQIKSKGGK